MPQDRISGERFCLYDRAALLPLLDRMAGTAAALLSGADDPLLLGILRRGVPLAEMLQARLAAQQARNVPRYALQPALRR